MHTKTVALRAAILAVLDGYTSINVRSLCYVLESTQVIHKTEADFDKVERLVVDLRREGLIPFGKISEGHRERLVPPTYESVGAFLTMVKNRYQRDIWATQPYHVEVWSEKNGLSDVIWPVCSRYRVPYVPTKGQPSITLLYNSAQAMIASEKRTHLLYVGDHDATGLNISRVIEEELREFGVDVTLHRVAVTPQQIATYNLPTRPGKQSDNKHAAFVAAYGPDCVEVDALQVVSQDLLPTLIRQAIEPLIDWDPWTAVADAENRDGARLDAIVAQATDIDGRSA